MKKRKTIRNSRTFKSTFTVLFLISFVFIFSQLLLKPLSYFNFFNAPINMVISDPGSGVPTKPIVNNNVSPKPSPKSSPKPSIKASPAASVLPKSSSTAVCHDGLATIKVGDWAATGYGLLEDGKTRCKSSSNCPRRECIQYLPGCVHSAPSPCDSEYKKDPKKVVLPPSAGAEYTEGKKTDSKYVPAPDSCVTDSGLYPTGNENPKDKTKICFNGKWIPKDLYNKSGDEYCKIKQAGSVYNPSSNSCSTSTGAIVSQDGNLADNSTTFNRNDCSGRAFIDLDWKKKNPQNPQWQFKCVNDETPCETTRKSDSTTFYTCAILNGNVVYYPVNCSNPPGSIFNEKTGACEVVSTNNLTINQVCGIDMHYDFGTSACVKNVTTIPIITTIDIIPAVPSPLPSAKPVLSPPPSVRPSPSSSNTNGKTCVELGKGKGGCKPEETCVEKYLSGPGLWLKQCELSSVTTSEKHYDFCSGSLLSKWSTADGAYKSEYCSGGCADLICHKIEDSRSAYKSKELCQKGIPSNQVCLAIPGGGGYYRSETGKPLTLSPKASQAPAAAVASTKPSTTPIRTSPSPISSWKPGSVTSSAGSIPNSPQPNKPSVKPDSVPVSVTTDDKKSNSNSCTKDRECISGYCHFASLSLLSGHGSCDSKHNHIGSTLDESGFRKPGSYCKSKDNSCSPGYFCNTPIIGANTCEPIANNQQAKNPHASTGIVGIRSEVKASSIPRLNISQNPAASPANQARVAASVNNLSTLSYISNNLSKVVTKNSPIVSPEQADLQSIYCTQIGNNNLTVDKCTWEYAGCGIMAGGMVVGSTKGKCASAEYYAELNKHYDVTCKGSDFEVNKDALERLGYTAVPVSGSVEQIKAQIEQYAEEGIPVWVNANIETSENSEVYQGHHTIAVGVNPDTGNIIFNDPYYGQTEEIPIERIDVDCTKSQCEGDVGSWIVYAFIPPDAEQEEVGNSQKSAGGT